jgi:hypothetical protein
VTFQARPSRGDGTFALDSLIAALACVRSDPGHIKRQYLCAIVSLVHDCKAYGRMIPIFFQHGRLLGLEPMDWLVLLAGIACAAVLAAAIAY